MKYIKLFEEIKAYHGSGNKFDTFNSINNKMTSTTYGYYFTYSEDVAKIYANENDDKYIYIKR